MTGACDATFEALTDCSACRVESAVVELIDASSGAGIVLESRCRLCLRELRGGSTAREGERFTGDEPAARAALTRWAEQEGDPDAERFVAAHFAGLGLTQVARALARGERIETSFDAVAWLFPGVGIAAGGGAPQAADELDSRATTPFVRPPQTSPRLSSTPLHRPSLPPLYPPTHASVPLHKQPLRVSARALCSVMLADGDATPSDRAFIDATLGTWGHPPLRDDDLAVWRPHELGWPHDAQAVVDAMARLAFVDGDRDQTEWRVTREFARVWGVSLDELEALGARLEREHQRGLRRVLSSLTSLFVR